MKKTTIVAALALASTTALAGGLNTNSNQNAAFLRNFAQEGQITLTSIYANPAGNVFLSPGWHLSLNAQTAYQQRNIETDFPLFRLNTKDATTPHKFKGTAKAPIIPSFSVSYNQPKWSVSAHFAIGGGGGKCEFNDGLGSFEALYSGLLAQKIPAAVQGIVNGTLNQTFMGMGMPAAQAQGTANALAATGTYKMTGYSLNSFMRGRNYYFGLQLGGAYKFTDNFAGYIGVRGVYANCNYNGYVQDVKANYSYNVPANPGAGFPGTQGEGTRDLSDYTLTLNCDQTGFGITPIIGLDWEINRHWNVAAKYEAPTKMNLKNETETNDFAKMVMAQGGSVLDRFADGGHDREDLPGILAIGAEYRLNEKVRFDGSFKTYFDKNAKKFNDEQDLVDKNTYEVALGAEYRCCKLITVSASWQRTKYGMSDAGMNDISFPCSDNSLGLGVRIHPSKYFNIDLGYMHTFYQDRTVMGANGKTDKYSRENNVAGIGFNFAL